MADNTHISWTDATWNPITGCSVVSPGCTNCYAMRLAGTRLKHHPSRQGLTDMTRAGPVWNGKVRFNEDALDQPLRWRKPRMIFVCAHGDLFHEDVPDEWIDNVVDVMTAWAGKRHIFQVLTKRADRMREYWSRFKPDGDGWITRDGHSNMRNPNSGPLFADDNFPPSNIWLGVSVEDQARADERIPLLLDTPAAIRWISAEPLLGPIDLDCVPRPLNWPRPPDDISDGVNALRHVRAGLDWVVAGGESAQNKPGRPMQIDWIRSIVQQCQSAGVACFVKQLGSNPMLTDTERLPLKHKKGGEMAEWPEDLQLQEMPHAQ